MANKRLKTALDERLAAVTVSPQLEKRIMTLPQNRLKAKRRSLVAIIVFAVLLIAFSALAATNSNFQRLLSLVEERIAQMLQPIERVSESNGVRMEVVAAMSDDRNAVVYIALQDLMGDRLEGLIDPYDWHISGTRISSSNTAPYDKETKTATLRLLAYGGEQLNGQKVTVSLRSFLMGRTGYENIDLGIPLDTVQEAGHTIWLDNKITGGGGGSKYDEFVANGGRSFLPPGEMRIPIPGVDFAYISNIGLVDGRLHVQTCFFKKQFRLSARETMDGNMDDHGYILLVKHNEQPLLDDNSSELSVSFCVDEQGKLCSTGSSIEDPSGHKTHYQEDVYPVFPDLSQYTLQGYFYTNKEYITGDWSVTFRLQAVEAFKQAACDIEAGSARIHTVMVSPMGWTILAEKESLDSTVQAEVVVKWADGTEQRFEINGSDGDGTRFEFHCFAEKPLDISLVQEVYVNGQRVQLE